MTAISRAPSRSLAFALALLCLSLLARALVVPVRGLRAEYFAADRAGSLPDVTAVDPQPTTAQVVARWRGADPDRFSVRWFGYLTAPAAGRYTFTLISDDGSTLAIDGRLLIDHGGAHGAEPKSGSIDLAAGSHPILLELTQLGGPFAIALQWARDDGRLADVPSWALAPQREPVWRVQAGRAIDALAVTAFFAAVGSLGWWIAAGGWRPSRHPRLAALALFALLACAHTWPIVTDPGHLTRHDNRDMILNEWIMSWVAHQAVTSPLHLYDGNIFYPETRTLAYSEPLIVQAAIGAPLLWMGASPVFVYNVVLLLGFTLTGWAAAVVVARWTGSWAAGLVSGATLAFCAHVITRIPHLQAQHAEFLPLALLALDTLLRRPSAANAAKLAGWCVLQGLTSVYLLAITIFVMGAALAARQAEWARRTTLPALKAIGITGVIAGLALLPFLLPYYRVSHDQGLTRSLSDAAQYSARWRDYLTTPARVHWSTWASGIGGGTGLFPGAIGLALTAVAIFRGVAFRDPRARMCLVAGGVGFYLSFGPSMPGYRAIYTVVPILTAIRAPARFGYMATLAVAMLAGFGVAALRGVVPARRWPAVAATLVCLAALEPLAAPIGLAPFDGIAPIFDRLPRRPGVVAVEVPFPGPRSAQFHAHAMLNSTRHWQPIVNGYSGFQPASFYRHAGPLQQFPGDEAIAMMREIGVTHVFVHTSTYNADQLRALARRPDLVRIDAFGETELYEVK